MPQINIKTPDGSTLTVPFTGAPPTDSDVQSIVNDYESRQAQPRASALSPQAAPPTTAPSPAQVPPTTPPASNLTMPAVDLSRDRNPDGSLNFDALKSDPGTPLTPAPSGPIAPLLPPPPTQANGAGQDLLNAEMLRRQGVLNTTIAGYNAQLKGHGVSDQDVANMMHALNDHAAWEKTDGFGDNAGTKQWIATNTSRGYGIDSSKGNAGGPSLLDKMVNDAKSDVQSFGHSLADMAGGTLGAVVDTNEEEGHDAALAQGRAAVSGLASGAVLHPLGLGPGEVTSNAIAAAQQGNLGQFAKGVPAGIAANAQQHPLNFGLDALTALGLAHAPLSALADRGIAALPDPAAGLDMNPVSAGEHIAQAESPAPVVTPHPTAPGANGAARATDGTFVSQEAVAPKPTVQVVRTGANGKPVVRISTPSAEAPVETPPNVGSNLPLSNAGSADTLPTSPQSVPAPLSAPAEALPAAGASASPAASPSGMAGSVNLDRLNVSPEAKGKIADAANALPAMPGTTRADIGAKAKALALTVDDLRNVEPGKYQVATDDLPAVGRAVRQLNAQHGQAAEAADATYQASPTPANLAAAVTENENLRIATAHNDRIASALSGGMAERAETIDPFTAKQRAVQGSLRPFQTSSTVNTAGAKAPDFGQSNTLFTPSDFQGALQGLKKLQGQVNSGLPPVVFKHLLTIGGYVFEGGLRAFPAWAKAVRGHAQGAGLNDPLADGDLRPVYKQLKNEAQRRAQAALSPKEMVRDQLLKVASPAQVPAITQDLAGVGVDKHGNVHTGHLAQVLARHSEQTVADFAKTALQAGLLSNPVTAAKIGLAHGLYLAAEELKRVPASIVSRGAVQGASLPAVGKSIKAAVTQGIPRAAVILGRGEPALNLSGRNPLHVPGTPIKPEISLKMDTVPRRFGSTSPAVQRGANMANEVLSAPLRAPGRIHGALLHAIGTGTLERARIGEATALAREEARGQKVQAGAPFKQYVSGRVSDLLMNPTQELTERTLRSHEELMLANANKAHDLLKSVDKMGGAAKLTRAVVSPFSGIPSNVAGKALEYSGGGLLDAPAKLLAARLRGEPLTPQQTAIIGNTFGRGVVGAGMVAAGYALGKRGFLNPPDEKKGEYGSANLAGRKVDISGLAPVSSSLFLGAKAQQLRAAGHPPSLMDVRDAATIPLADQPLVQGVKGLSDLLTGDPSHALSGYAGEVVPSGLAWYASQTDPAHAARIASGPLDAIKKRIPGQRETLPIKRDLYGSPVPETDASFFGLRSRALGPTDTPAAQMMKARLQARRPQGEMSAADAAGYTQRQTLLGQARAGLNVTPALTTAVRAGQMTMPQARALLRDAHLPPAAAKFAHLTTADALDVYAAGNQGERAQWQTVLLHHLEGAAKSHTLTPLMMSRARMLGVIR